MASLRTESNPVRFATDPAPAWIRLTDEERTRVTEALVRCGVGPRALCAEAASDARIVPRAPTLSEVRGARSLIAHVALAGRADGIALGRRVFVRRHLVVDGRVSLALAAHEVTHVAQYRRDGVVPFLLRYAAAYLAGRARGLDDHRAYLAIPYEVEARAVAASLEPGGAQVRVLR